MAISGVWERFMLNTLCLQAVADIIARGGYASIDAVVRSVCAWQGVQYLEQLGVSVQSTPALALLLHIEQTVAACAAAFVATHGIACLVDFEREVVSALHVQCVPPLVNERASAVAPSSFASFMVGPLVQHPSVRAHWPLAHACDRDAAIGYAEVAQMALELLVAGPMASTARPPPQHTDPAALRPAALGAHIEQRTGRSLAQLGVMLVPHALPRVSHALRHSAHALRSLEVAATNLALERLHSRPEHAALAQQRSRQQPSRRKIVPGSVPKLHPPKHPRVARVLEACRATLSPNGSPTFAKTRAAVDRLASKVAAGSAAGDGSNGKGRAERVIDREVALLLATLLGCHYVALRAPDGRLVELDSMLRPHNLLYGPLFTAQAMLHHLMRRGYAHAFTISVRKTL